MARPLKQKLAAQASRTARPAKLKMPGSGIGWLENWMSSKYIPVSPVVVVEMVKVSCATLPA
jgi:hypothetical protein